MKKFDQEILQSQKRMRSGDQTMDRLLSKSQQLLKQNKVKLNQKIIVNELRNSMTAPHRPSSPRKEMNGEKGVLDEVINNLDMPNRLHPNLYRYHSLLLFKICCLNCAVRVVLRQ
jgi:hypothetical protein